MQTTARICLLQALSPVGRCQTFDARADGYGRGEAIALGLLHHPGLVAEGSQPVLARVWGSAVNQDGRSSSLTAPNGPAQTALVRAALDAAAAPPLAVASVSLHGTGTPLGDPIEVGALAAALASGKLGGGDARVVALGSSKSCYGHTEGTAGLTGALLAAAGLQQQACAPIVNLRQVNPYVSAALADWRSRHGVAAAPSRQLAAAPHLAGSGDGALAGSSSFGMSGVNAHALLSTGSDAPSGAPQLAAGSAEPSWRRATCWPAPIPHPLLLAALPGAGGTAEFTADLGAARLAWMWDHAVHGRPLLPGAAMFELAGTAVAACAVLDGSVRAHSLLTGLGILAPCTLPARAAGAAAGMLLRCSLNCRTGALRVASGRGSVHLAGLAAVATAADGATSAAVPTSRTSLCSSLQLARGTACQGHNLAVVSASRQDAAG